MAGRQIKLIDDRNLARKRLAIFAGMEMPSTIVRKELVDNAIDVVNERGQKATKAIVRIGKNRIQVMDNGDGISTDIMEGTDRTHLWHACTTMFSSSNYEGVEDTVGANGVGLTMVNYTSKYFTVAVLGKSEVKGYRFVDGFLCGTDECIDNVKGDLGELFSESDLELASLEGDMVEHPVQKEEFISKFKPLWSEGFMVDATWLDAPNGLFPDNGCDINWLMKYAKLRVGEITSGTVIFEIYKNDIFEPENLLKAETWTKDKESEFYVPSWHEQAKEHGAVLVKDGEWTIAFSKSADMKLESMVQGAPVNSRFTHNCSIQIQDYSVQVPVPISFYYMSKEYPNYQDQTKTSIRFPYAVVNRAFERSGEVYRHFYHEAEKAYMAKVSKTAT